MKINIKNIYFVFLFFILTIIESSFAQGVGYYTCPYTIEKNETFASVIKRFVKPDSVINAKTPMIKKTMSANPKVSDWSDLPSGKEITVYISPEFADLDKIKKLKELHLKKIADKKAKEKKELLTSENASKKFSIFYMASTGRMTETLSSSDSTVQYNQNSPATFGLSFQNRNPDKKWSLSMSAYLSYLPSATVDPNESIKGGSTSVPPEYGVTVYAQHATFKKLSLYGGADFERFSSLNINEIYNLETETVASVNHQVFYATFGSQYVMKPWIFKTSFSKSLWSKISTPSKSPYAGYKVLFYAIYPIKNRPYSLLLLIKHHEMSGATKLGVNRIGLGLSYAF